MAQFSVRPAAEVHTT